MPGALSAAFRRLTPAMLVRDAREAARRWVIQEVATRPGFGGAFFHGSTTDLADDDRLPATSDIDVLVVQTDSRWPLTPGKRRFRDVVLDVSFVPNEELNSPELVLGRSDLAGSLRAPSVIADPSGRLTELHAAVARDFPRRIWVERRRQHATEKIRRHLRGLNEPGSFHDHVTPWLFATGVTTHVLLVAGLRNPTVRRRYLMVRELLAEYGRLPFHETLLELLGCARMSRRQAERHLAAVTIAFDAAVDVIRTPFFFAGDISEAARPIAIDGSRELIARGDHREAVFWLVDTYDRCRQALTRDAPAGAWDEFAPGYDRLLADLGIGSSVDLHQRGGEVEQFLPRLWAEAEAIMAANEQIEDDPSSSD